MKWGKRWTEDDFTGDQLREIGRMEMTIKRDKYNRRPKWARTVDGIVFDSKKEMEFYLQLKLDPTVKFFLRQVPFHLPAGIKYLADFIVFYHDGSYEVIDVKGVRTTEYKMKKKLVTANYPVTIKEI